MTYQVAGDPTPTELVRAILEGREGKRTTELVAYLIEPIGDQIADRGPQGDLHLSPSDAQRLT